MGYQRTAICCLWGRTLNDSAVKRSCGKPRVHPLTRRRSIGLTALQEVELHIMRKMGFQLTLPTPWELLEELVFLAPVFKILALNYPSVDWEDLSGRSLARLVQSLLQLSSCVLSFPARSH